MCSRQYEIEATLTIRGEERDVPVRAHVERELSGRGWTAMIDGDVEVLVDGQWVDPSDVGVPADELERAIDELGHAAHEDDSDYDYEEWEGDDE